jgi:hypothetical protein
MTPFEVGYKLVFGEEMPIDFEIKLLIFILVLLIIALGGLIYLILK